MVLKARKDYGPAPAADAIQIALCTDENYARHAMVVLASVRANTAANLAAHLLVAELTPAIEHMVSESAAKLGMNISVHVVDNAPFAQIRMTMIATHATYYRLMIANVAPHDRVIYLDCDVIVQDDIKILADWNLDGALIAGVPDRADRKSANAHLGLDADEPYLNAGVLVINADGWRKADFYRRACVFVAEHSARLKLHDQDVLNVLCAGEKCVLPLRWNVPQRKFGNKPLASVLPPVNQFRGIFHATGPLKPWLRWADPWSRDLYLTYANGLGFGIDPRDPATPFERAAHERALVLEERPVTRPKLVNRMRRGQTTSQR